MKILVAGSGKVGTALKFFFEKNKVHFKIYSKNDKPVGDVIFIALHDSSIKNSVKNISSGNREIKIVQFTPAVELVHPNQFVLHPYASISKETDISTIFFTLWGKRDAVLEEILNECGFNYFYTGDSPGPGYHTSAVIAGNFTQFFYLSAKQILEKEGFSGLQCEKLISQLIDTSLRNIISSGVNGVTGPASRGDTKTVEKDFSFLNSLNVDFAEVFKKINEMITKAVKSGNVL